MKLPIQMVDLVGQYQNIKLEIDKEIQEVLDTAYFIKGPKVKQFEESLANYLGCEYVISCANGTDALQIALMALDLKPGDEIIVPAFTYAATAEVIALLQLKPVMVDVDYDTFNTTVEIIEQSITSKTKAIVPVHLYGQSSDMEGIMKLANEKGVFVVEDNAQAIGADNLKNGNSIGKTGTLGHIGCTSFFPSKNLGCFGDGGALYTNDTKMGERIRMIANHGQSNKYVHDVIGVNSRLDAIQAAILNVKLKYLDQYAEARKKVAKRYDEAFINLNGICTPKRCSFSSHVFHQYTLQIKDEKRNALKKYLKEKGIPTMIYYPIPLYNQKAYKGYYGGKPLKNTERLCNEVLSLPIHTEMREEVQEYIIDSIKSFFSEK